MAKYTLLVYTNCKDGRDAEFNRWYDEQHIPDVLSLDGFIAARRFDAIPVPGVASDQRYLAMYDIESDAPPHSLLEQLASAGPKMVVSDALDPATVKMQLFARR